MAKVSATLEALQASDFKTYFVRDFKYTASPDYSGVLDADITKAYRQALYSINPNIFENDDVLTDAYLYLSAHFLVMDMKMARTGVNNAAEGVVTSKGVGSVNVGFSMPQDMAKSAFLSELGQTMYGQKYLAYVRPRTVGIIGVAQRDTNP